MKLTHKDKLMALIASALLLLIVGYFMAFSKTITMYRENTTMNAMDASNTLAVKKRLIELQKSKALIDSVMSLPSEGNLTKLTEDMVKRSNQLGLSVTELLVDYPTPQSNNVRIGFGGPFVQLVKQLRYIERSTTAEYNAITFEKKMDRRTKEKRLEMAIDFNIFK